MIGGGRDDPVPALLRSGPRGAWLACTAPKAILIAREPSEVVPVLHAVEQSVEGGGLQAVGFVSYEAAPAFDPAYTVHADAAAHTGFPLAGFLLWDGAGGSPGPAGPRSELETLPALRWRPSLGFRSYRAAIEQVRNDIARGHTYQVNYTLRLHSQGVEDPWVLFAHLAQAQDAPYAAYLEFDDWVVCSASPELFFRLDGDRIVSLPMKGTTARGRTRAEDRHRARSLRDSPKDRAENLMIVDMVRSDIGRIARTGSVQVTDLFGIERYPTVWQMTSRVEARTGAGLGEIFRALFPAASVTGAPRARTMEIIAGLETAPRRIYTGAVGWVAPGRRAQFSVAIRTALVDRRTKTAEYGVGGGIVWDSTPEGEWAECKAKARILRGRKVGRPRPADRIETAPPTF